MTLPIWDDPTLKAGTMVRTALWLISEIGVGNSFTKEQHRAAFPGITQADRRLRDLRRFGWVIHTSAEDLTLNSDEQRFIAAGSPVWERELRKIATKGVLSAKMRAATLAEDNYQCVLCGIAGGENYPDAPHMTAVLGVTRRAITVSDGCVQTMFVAECKRCHSGAVAGADNVPLLLASINGLDHAEKALLARWVEHGRRGALERVWSDFRRLPAAARDQVRARLTRE